MQARVNFNCTLSEEIPVENGVKQGDILAPTLFAIFFSVVFIIAFKNNDVGVYIRYRTTGKVFNLRRFASKTKVFISLIRDLLYADDCDLLTHTEQDMQNLMNLFSSACKMLGLEISLKKTVIVFQPAPGNAYVEPSIFVDNTKLKVVDSFVYLGSTLSQSGSLDKEIILRIKKASFSFGKLQARLWSQHDIKLATNILKRGLYHQSIYRACVLTALLYASETWTIYNP